jgi:hypothetical protein
MEGFGPLGKALLIMGLIMVGIGLIIMFGSKIPYLGRLPGDIHVQKKNFTFYFPLATSVLISIILTVVFTLFYRK